MLSIFSGGAIRLYQDSSAYPDVWWVHLCCCFSIRALKRNFHDNHSRVLSYWSFSRAHVKLIFFRPTFRWRCYPTLSRTFNHFWTSGECICVVIFVLKHFSNVSLLIAESRRKRRVFSYWGFWRAPVKKFSFRCPINGASRICNHAHCFYLLAMPCPQLAWVCRRSKWIRLW